MSETEIGSIAQRSRSASSVQPVDTVYVPGAVRSSETHAVLRSGLAPSPPAVWQTVWADAPAAVAPSAVAAAASTARPVFVEILMQARTHAARRACGWNSGESVATLTQRLWRWRILRDMCRTQRSDVERASRIKADDVRPSDAEREEIVSQLRGHAGDGRLDVEELEQRVARAYAAESRRDLVAITKDLPRPPRARHDHRRDFAEHLRSYLAVMALLVVIWALTGMGYFWPVWPMLGWGIGVFSHWSAVGRPPRRARLTV
jgi:hypothetical protein